MCHLPINCQFSGFDWSQVVTSLAVQHVLGTNWILKYICIIKCKTSYVLIQIPNLRKYYLLQTTTLVRYIGENDELPDMNWSAGL